MAGPRSPSPVLTRPTTNPNLRASETNSSVRRSFTGNPFAKPSLLANPKSFIPNTPANSPAEFGRKVPVGKESSSRGFEEKENEKGLTSKGIKVKSPSTASKHFMSPTISAASKFTPSPRKRILGERNELIRASISFSDGKESSVSDFDTRSETGINQNIIEGSSDLAGFNKKEVFEAPSVPKASKRVTFSNEVLPIAHHESDRDNDELSPYSKLYSSSMSPFIAPYEVPEIPIKSDNQPDYVSKLNMQSDSVILDSGPFSSHAIAPLDADPSFPPYDPKTNYLSPRPQFLRYKPNRRMEGLNFEESKEFEDSDVTEETESGDSQKESEDGSTAETLPSEEEEALLLSEPTAAGTPISDCMLKQIFEAKPDFFTISKSEEEELMFSEPTLTGSSISTQMLEPVSITRLKPEEEEALLLSEPTPPSGTPISTHMLKQIFEAQRAPKPGFFTRSKCISLLLVLLIVCVSVSVMDVSITSSPVIKNLSFYKLYESSEIAALTRKMSDGLAGNFQHWYESSEIAVFARAKIDGLRRNFQQWYDSSEIAVFARAKIDGLLRNFQQWYESSEIAVFARAKIDGLIRNFKQYSSQTISYISVLIPHLGEVAKSVSVPFCNLTDSQEHSLKNGYFEVNHQKKIAEIYDEYELKPVAKEEAARKHLEEKAQSENVVNEHNEEESEVQMMIQAEMNYSEIAEEVLDQEQIDTELQSNTESEDRSADVNEYNEEESEVQKMIQAEMNYSEIAEEVLELEQIDTELQSNTESEDRPADVNEYNEEESEVQKMIQAEMIFSESNTEEVLDLKQIDTELQSNKESEDRSVIDSLASKPKSEVEAPEVITPMEFVDETKSSIPERNSESKAEVVSSSHMEFQVNNDASTDETLYNVAEVNSEFSADTAISEVVENALHTTLGVSVLVIAAMVASAFIYLKQGKNTTVVNGGVVHVKPKQTKNMIQNSPTNSDMSGEWCPSEMSSFQTSSYSKGALNGTKKVQSQERKPRPNLKRESLASSSEFSTGSPSYGSFTTYERIPLKHASGDEEIVTPVRRSSRIRSQFTSP